MTRHVLVAALCLFVAASCTSVGKREAANAPSLTLASWNMEHLAERNNAGCRPRTDADYAAMRAYVAALDADVVAFQEVESKQAAERVFDPALYAVEIEARTGSDRHGECRGRPGLTINAQRTGIAIRKGVAYQRLPDVTGLQLGNPDLRSGVDVIVRPSAGTAIRVLSVHLKSGCSSGNRNDACTTLLQQLPVLEQWIDQRAGEGLRFALLGDYNRRLSVPGDVVWTDLDDGLPANADLARASGDQHARCNPRYPDFIDYIVLDRRAAEDLVSFEESRYTGDALSDHCAIAARLSLR